MDKALVRFANKWIREVPSRAAKYGRNWDEMSEESRALVAGFLAQIEARKAQAIGDEITDRHTAKENREKDRREAAKRKLIRKAADAIVRRVGGRVSGSELSASTYVTTDSGLKIRISDHQAAPTYEALNGCAFREIAVCAPGFMAHYSIMDASDVKAVVAKIEADVLVEDAED